MFIYKNVVNIGNGGKILVNGSIDDQLAEVRSLYGEDMEKKIKINMKKVIDVEVVNDSEVINRFKGENIDRDDEKTIDGVKNALNSISGSNRVCLGSSSNKENGSSLISIVNGSSIIIGKKHNEDIEDNNSWKEEGNRIKEEEMKENERIQEEEDEIKENEYKESDEKG